jgi:hypothetical protein
MLDLVKGIMKGFNWSGKYVDFGGQISEVVGTGRQIRGRIGTGRVRT